MSAVLSLVTTRITFSFDMFSDKELYISKGPNEYEHTHTHTSNDEHISFPKCGVGRKTEDDGQRPW